MCLPLVVGGRPPQDHNNDQNAEEQHVPVADALQKKRAVSGELGVGDMRTPRRYNRYQLRSLTRLATRHSASLAAV